MNRIMAAHLVYLWMAASVMPRSISRRAVVSGLMVTTAPWPSHATTTEVFTFEEQSLGLDLKQIDGRVRIERIKPDSPALAKGVPPQSFIVEVNGQSTADLSIEAVTSLIRSASRPMELRLDASAFRALPAPRRTEGAANALGMASDAIQPVPRKPFSWFCCGSKKALDVAEIDVAPISHSVGPSAEEEPEAEAIARLQAAFRGHLGRKEGHFMRDQLASAASRQLWPP